MAAAASIAAAAIGAAGAIGGGILSSKGAKDAASAAQPRPQRIPLPPQASAINQMAARALAMNLGAVPPSFSDYVRSGGRATFPFQHPGFTPPEVRKLGFIDVRGNPVPFVDPVAAQSGDLNPEQTLFLARWLASQGRGGQLARLGKLSSRIERLEDKAPSPRREARLERLRGRLANRMGDRG